MAQKVWSSRINTNTMAERLILTIFVVAAFVLLGLWLRSGALLDWFATVAVMTAAAFFGSVLRGTPLDAAQRRSVEPTSRFGPLLAWATGHPIWRYLTTNLALRVLTAFVFAIAVATLEQGVTSLLFGSVGWPPLYEGAASLLLVLTLTYWLLDYMRSRAEPEPRTTELLNAVEHIAGSQLFDLPPGWRALVFALLKALGAVFMRAAAVLILPAVFSNWFAVAFFAVSLVALILGGETNHAVFLKLSAIGQLATERDTKEEPK